MPNILHKTCICSFFCILAYIYGFCSTPSPVDEANQAALYRSIGDYPSAIKQYKLLIKEKTLDKETLKYIYLPLAESYYYLNKLSDAEEVFQKILSVFPDYPPALFGMGRVSFALGKFDKSAEILKQAVKVNPDFPGNYIYLARVKTMENEIEKARSFYIQALKKDSHQVELRYYLARLYQSLGLNEEAYKQYHRLENVDSKNALVLAKINGILPLLARKPEDIIKVKTLRKFSPLRVVKFYEKIPVIRIGINTTHRGKILPMETLTFLSSGAFNIISKNGVVFEGKKEIIYRISIYEGKPIITDGTDEMNVKLPKRFSIQLKDPENDSIILKEIEYAKGFAWSGIEDRQYRRKLKVSVVKHGFKLINEINLEEYLYGVVPSEMMISFPLAALKAQAVIARTYALYRLKFIHPHKKDGFDLCDCQHCQVYKGVSNEWKKTNNVIDATRGEVLYYKGKLTHPLFHSNCGGHTISSNELKGWGDVPYLTGRVDGAENQTFPSSPVELEEWIKSKPPVYCNIPRYGWEPEFRWFRIVEAELLEEKINRIKNIGKIKKIAVKKRSASGHVLSVHIRGTIGDLLIDKEHKIRRSLGVGPLRSNLFWIETKFSSDGMPSEFIYYGGGWGHGVGMCQSGAAGMAEHGYSYTEILQHYYKDTEIKKLSY